MIDNKLLELLRKTYLNHPEYLSILLDKAPYGVLIVNNNKKMLFYNKKAEELTGYSKEEVLSKKCIMLDICTNCKNNCSLFDFGLDNTENTCRKDLELFKKDGTPILIEKSSYTMVNLYGEKVGAIEFFIDKGFHEREKEKVDQLKKTLSTITIFNQELLSNSTFGVIKLNKKREIIFINKKAAYILGFKPEQLLNKNISLVSDTFLNNIENSRNNKILFNFKDKKLELTSISNNKEKILFFKNRSNVKNSKNSYYNMISNSPSMKKIFRLIENLKNSSVNVLIEGDSGTGKELIAKALYQTNNKYNNVFQTINCATLSAELLESELFGHVKGAFTGAITNKDGKFKLGDGGTVFLDEIGELPLDLQAKLLRVLQFQEFDLVGGGTVKVDVRIVAATNKNLEEAIEEKTFRKDLYYRLKVVPIYLPKLKNRKEDIPLLINYFIDKNSETKKITISNEALKILIDYSWPGNIRELENLISYLFAVTNKDIIEVDDLPTYITKLSYKTTEEKADLFIHSEKDRIIEVLTRNNFNQNKAADELHIHRTTLWRKIKKYNISLS